MAEQEKLLGEMHQMWEIYKKCMPDVAIAYDEFSGFYKTHTFHSLYFCWAACLNTQFQGISHFKF